MLRCLVLKARHCRHYARRRPVRGGKDARAARDKAFSPTLGKPTKPESHHPMHGASSTASAASTAEPPDERVTIIGSLVFVVGVMGAGTMAYRLYSFGEVSTQPVEPQQAPPEEAGSAEAGAELSAPLTITALPTPVRAVLPERMLWFADDPFGRQVFGAVTMSALLNGAIFWLWARQRRRLGIQKPLWEGAKWEL